MKTVHYAKSKPTAVKTLFQHIVPNLFKPQEQKEREQLERIQQQRQQRENLQHVAARLTAFMDAVPVARARCDALCRAIDDGCCNPPAAQFAGDIARGVPLKDLAEEMAAHDALKKHAEPIKCELERLIVGMAEKSLADFRKANAADIKKLPPLKKVAEPAFIPALPVNDGALVSEPPSAGVRMMLGLKPGETLAPAPFETSNKGMVQSDVDDDD